MKSAGVGSGARLAPCIVPGWRWLLLVVLAMTLALGSRAEAYVYWANPDEGTIGRANLDGTGVDERFITGAVQPFGIAVNRAHIYWITGAVDPPTIGRANLDGTGAKPRFIVDAEVDPTGLTTGSVAVDGQHVFWVSRFADNLNFVWQPRTGAIGRANVDGTGIDEEFITGVSFPIGAMAVDRSHLYWTNYPPQLPPYADFIISYVPSRIGRANLDGTGVDEDFISEDGVAAMAVDGSHVYWLWNGFSRSEGDLFGIERANLDGTGAEIVIPSSGPVFAGSGCGVAVDDVHVYWAGPTPDQESPQLAIGRAKLDGTRANNEFITTRSCGGVAVDGLGPRPSNEFALGNVRKNKKRGTAKLTVKVPGPGELALGKNAKVKGKQKGADAAGRQKLPIKPRRKAKKRLEERGKAKVRAKVTYTPDGGSPNTENKKIKLVKR